MHSVKKVTDIVSEIAAASSEQTEGIDQINKAVCQIDEMTQRNAALVEEAAAASQTLRQEAGQLDAMTTFFKTCRGEISDAMPSMEPVSEERRAGGRPWSGGEQDNGAASQNNESGTPSSKRAVSGGEDVWEEF